MKKLNKWIKEKLQKYATPKTEFGKGYKACLLDIDQLIPKYDFKDVREIVEIFLEQDGYDGLYQPGVCACRIDDLAPCDEMEMNCTPGYLLPGDEDFNWRIGSNKKEPPKC